MDDSNQTHDSGSDSPTDPKPIWRRVMYFALSRGAVIYLGVCLVVFLIQRQMIFHPSRVDRITAKDAQIDPEFVEDIEVATSDGLMIRGWYFKAVVKKTSSEAADESPNRVIIFFHGNAGDRRHRLSDVRNFREHGLDVLLIDYRGYGDNPGQPTAEGLAMDAKAAWKYLTDTREMPPDRILIFGESLGTGVATRLAAECCQDNQEPGGLILRSAFSSIADAAGERFPWLPVRMLLRDRFPSDTYIADVTCPIFMIHGDQDRTISYRLGQKLFAAAPEQSTSGFKKRFLTLEGVGHNDILSAAGRKHIDALNGFLDDLP
ncbi:alpha/beta hydrolase [Thalassoroseus pseudoceratinae]|uniref:alpha/beta hydrolase n=1 Tax=Thalassoroseus pseudoceratinae TaxID=2713176 RepID=UPI0014228236|nr:alpha/beta hydrolase [Thalassoroseus pseudoceratinae]